MSAASSFSLDGLLAAVQGREQVEVFTASAVMAGQRITVECDDRQFFEEFYTMFGGSEPVRGRMPIASSIHLDIRSSVDPQYGCFRMTGANELPADGHEFSFAVESETGTFERCRADEAGWICFAFRRSDKTAFALRGPDCLFALGALWRTTIVWYLFWRLLRIRSDAIFFHASALGIFGEGTIFVGPGGAGKSTISLALAARGHGFLSDEVAGYLPERGELIPFRRPVGIKPGPRASAVERALAPGIAERIERDGFLRVDINTLFPVEPPQSLPLRRIVFLRGFEERPAMARITPGAAEICELQPLMSSFLNASHSRRVFELVRLLATAKVYELRPGAPDETALFLEEAFARE
jgi:hypothetical protein